MLFLESSQNPECLSIALETTEVEHLQIQFSLAVMTEWRMAEVVRETSKLNKIGVDVGFTKGGVLIWDVVAPQSGMKRGALEGPAAGVKYW